MTTPLLQAQHVAKRFGRRQVLTDATFSIQPGELLAVTGENGAGKSTLLRIMAGLLAADAGTVRRDVPLGYCPQESLVFDRLTVRENFRYFGAAYGIPDWRSAVTHWAERLGFAADTGEPVSHLSGGTRQKLNLALALLHQPALLLLDEPYAAFDWETYLTFWNLAGELRAVGCGILVVSHFVYDRDRFDRVVKIADGTVCPV